MVAKWIKIRILLLVFVALMQFFAYILDLQVLIKPKINVDNIIAINIYIFFGVLVLILVETIRIKNADRIQKINWNTTIFTRTHPLQFVNYSGWLIFSSYVIPTLHSFIIGSQYFLDNIFILSFGVTTIVSTHFTAYLFKRLAAIGKL